MRQTIQQQYVICFTGACRYLSHLPRPTRKFVNRKQEIEDIKKHLLLHPENDCSCVLVHGAVGMGKTATAVKAVNEIRDNDDNTAVVYINCCVVNSCDDLAAKISQQIYHFPLNESTAEIKRRLISEKDLLVILLLDNFQYLEPLDRNDVANMNPEITRIDQTEGFKVKKFITEIITASTNVKLLVTSSVLAFFPETCQQMVSLHPLERRASFELLKNTYCTDRQLDEEIAYKIADICDGIPLALISLASWQDHPPDLVQMMTNANPKDQFKKFIAIPETDASKKIDVCLDACFYRLDQDLRHTLICLSLFKGHFTMSTAKEVFCSEGLEGRILELASRSFLERNILGPKAPCWYSLLGVQKLYCQNKAEEEGAKQEYENGRKRFIDYFLSLLEKVFKKFLSKRAFEACNIFRQEVENIMQLLDWFKSGVMDEERTLKCIDVFNKAAELLAMMMGEKRFNAVFNLLKDKCQQLQDKERLSDCLTSLGIKKAFSSFFSPHLSVEAGKIAKDYFMEADRIQSNLPIDTGNSRAQCLAKYARCVSIIDGNFAKGKEMIQKAITIRETHGEEDRVMLGATYNDLAGKAPFIWTKPSPGGRLILPAESTLASVYMGKRLTPLLKLSHAVIVSS